MRRIPLVLLAAFGCTTPSAWTDRSGPSDVGQVEPPAVIVAEHPRSPSEVKLAAALAAREAGDQAGARVLVAEAVADALAESVAEDRVDHWEALGRLAQATGELRAARQMREQVLALRTRTLPDDHLDLQRARGDLAATIRILGDLQGARTLQEQVLAVLQRTLPDEHLELQIARHNLATTIRLQGDLAGARLLFEQALSVLERTLPADDPRVLLARQNLAVTIGALGDLAGARELFEQVLAISSRTLPEDHTDLQAARANLAVAMARLGELAGARVLQERVLAVLERTLPEEHPTLQSARQNLAATMAGLGDPAGARALEERVLAVLERRLPDVHPDLQLARQNLAAALKEQGDLAGARVLEERVLDARARTLPDEHPDLQLARLNLGVTLQELGDWGRARALQEQVLAIYERTLPEAHPDLQAAQGNLAVTFANLGDLAGATALLEHVLDAYEQTVPADHPNLQWARQLLAVTRGAEFARGAIPSGDEAGPPWREAIQTCTTLLLSAAAGRVSAFTNALTSASPRETEENASAGLKTLDWTLSFALGHGALGPLPALEPAAFLLSETTRCAALRSVAWQRRAADSEEHETLRARVRAAGDALARLVQSGGGRDSFHAARMEREMAQRELAALARDLADGVDPVGPIDVGAVVAGLGADEAVVAYRRFSRWDVRVAEGARVDAVDAPELRKAALTYTSTASLCAFVVRAAPVGTRPVLTLLDLGPLQQVGHEVAAWQDACGLAETRGIATPSQDSSALSNAGPTTNSAGARLRRLLLDPLDSALRDARRIVVVHDDVTNVVPLDALPRTDGGLVGDRVRIEVRNTLAELLEPSGAPANRGIALTLGDARFDSEPVAHREDEPTAASELTPRKPRVASLLRGTAWEAGFTALENTGPEARGVANLWNQVAGTERGAVVLAGPAASKISLTELAPRARWLHVATHGWHAPESVRSFEDVVREPGGDVAAFRASANDVVAGMSPLLLCGLALAGANLPEDAVGRAPGLLTAEEMSALDLSNCELAVLSACDTNVGIRRAGQGVASFQRALQMAGARSVITSLWKVPDEATRELMLDFYRRIWVSKQPKWQALWDAKMAIRNAKDERGNSKYSTRDWAAWVLTGEPD